MKSKAYIILIWVIFGAYFSFGQTFEHLTASHGKGAGFMVNATYSGSGNPQSSSTFTINPGTYNASAGYLDYDGNSKRWTLFNSAGSSGIGTAVTFKELAILDEDFISFSPTGNGTDFYLDSNGKVGIGTTSPGSRLHVLTGSTNALPHGFSKVTVEHDDNAMISLLTPSNKYGYYGFGDGDDGFVGGMQYSHSANQMSFRVNNESEGSLVIAADGKVGIGATTPAEKLEVVGNVKVTGHRKIIQSASNSSAEHIIVSHGQGGGWMINAETSSPSENPETDATFTVSPGTYSPSAGYLDFDGNARRWSFFVSGATTGAGNAATFTQRGVIDTDRIWFSPTGDDSQFYLQDNGRVGIGTTSPSHKLSVDGTIQSEEVIVEVVNGPDYVFEESYHLRSLKETEAYIKANKHLPEIPSAKEMEANGVEVGEMNMLLLKKIEELTLHQIELLKKIEGLSQELESMREDN